MSNVVRAHPSLYRHTFPLSPIAPAWKKDSRKALGMRTVRNDKCKIRMNSENSKKPNEVAPRVFRDWCRRDVFHSLKQDKWSVLKTGTQRDFSWLELYDYLTSRLAHGALVATAPTPTFTLITAIE